MKPPAGTSGHASTTRRDALLRQGDVVRRGLLKLLRIKDSDIRQLILEQCREAVDKSLHAGGALSATIPLVALYYGGFLRLDVRDPTRRGQDMFVLSKGHAVAALAAIYAELGYLDRAVLANSRSYHSILNGHPGPILPGVPIATGPMGQGLGVAQGFAIAGRTSPRFDVYTLTGDGELQEGPIWEAVMYAGQAHLDNLCVLVDRNHGQLDVHTRTVFPMPDLVAVFRSFDWDAARRRRDRLRRRLRCAREIPTRPAKWPADGDHLREHQGSRRFLRVPESPQGHGARRAHRAGACASGRGPRCPHR